MVSILHARRGLCGEFVDFHLMPELLASEDTAGGGEIGQASLERMERGCQCFSVSDWRSAMAASVQKSHVQYVRCLSAAKLPTTERPRFKE